MPARTDRIRLGAFLYPTGHHVAAWRHPQAQADAGANFAHYVYLAQLAERGCFDTIFMADSLGTRGSDLPALSRVATRYVAQFEPITLLSGLAAATRHIGLIATASTSYNEPYHIARKFASLDQISGGRAGWNLVTSSNEAEAFNFGRDHHFEHAERYERAEEFVDVVRGLWNSWEDDSFPCNQESGVFLDVSRMHVLNHKGKHFQVRGPLNVARSPQGEPVIVQAGASDAGKDVAARTAGVIFAAQITLEDAVRFYRDIKGRMAKFGRNPADLKIMPGAFPVVGRTQMEAEDKFAVLQDLIHPEVGLSLIQGMMQGVDLSEYPLDGPVPQQAAETNASKSRQTLLLDLARREGLTIRQLYLRVAGARGHWQLIGTPAQIADALQERFEAFGADGFNIMPPVMPGGLEDFVTLVVPELQRRRLMRTVYHGQTLRDNLGLLPSEHLLHTVPHAAE